MSDEEDSNNDGSVSALDHIFNALGNFARAKPRAVQTNSGGAAPRAGAPTAAGRPAVRFGAKSCCLAKRPGQR